MEKVKVRFMNSDDVEWTEVKELQLNETQPKELVAIMFKVFNVLNMVEQLDSNEPLSLIHDTMNDHKATITSSLLMKHFLKIGLDIE